MIDALPRHRPRERGMLLIVMMVVMVALAGLAGALITLGADTTVREDASRGRARALVNAESGVDRALAQLLEDGDNLDPIEEQYDDGDSIKYRVTLTQLGDDGIDNDGNGKVDEAEEDQLVMLDSVGALNVTDFDKNGDPVTHGGSYYTKRIRAVGRQELPDAFAFPYAVYLGDPFAVINLNGNAFFIDGHDYTADGKLTTQPAMPGIATTGTTTNIVNQLSKQQKDNVEGKNGYPSVFNTTKVDLAAIIKQYKASADVKLSGTQVYTNNLGDYEKGDFPITYFSGGTLKISGGGHGAGLLLVDGNLEITGGWEYRGIVVATGQVIFKGGGGGKRLIGTCLVGGDIVESKQSNDDLEITGTVDVLYSSTVQSQVAASLGTFTIINWQEL